MLGTVNLRVARLTPPYSVVEGGIIRGMSHDRDAAYKLVLVPADCIRTHSPRGVLPAYVTVSQDVLFQVIADVAEDKRITMSRLFFEQQVDVIGPA